MPTHINKTDWKQLAKDILRKATHQGATAAEVAINIGKGFSVCVRKGEVDTVEYSHDKEVAVTVYFDHKQGIASTTDPQERSIDATISAACHIAQATGSDPYSGLAEKQLMATQISDLLLFHPWNIDTVQAIKMAKKCEALAMAEDERITNSEGASVATYESDYIYANTHDFIGHYSATRHSMSCVMIAEQAGNMQRDYYYTVARDPQDLKPIKFIATEAANRTIRRLGAKQLSTRQCPVVFSPEMSRSIFGSFIAAISGGNLYRKRSFLLDKLGKPIFPEFINIYEEPHLLKGLGSTSFDNEGVSTQKRNLVTRGILQSYVLSSYSARKLNMQTTGNAGGVHNLFVEPSDVNFTQLLSRMDTGLLVTEMMGQGINLVTGDFSRGAAGFWVEKGEIQYPVEEITIAGNLRDMFTDIEAVANDVDNRGNIQTGSILVKKMMVAGN